MPGGRPEASSTTRGARRAPWLGPIRGHAGAASRRRPPRRVVNRRPFQPARPASRSALHAEPAVSWLGTACVDIVRSRDGPAGGARPPAALDEAPWRGPSSSPMAWRASSHGALPVAVASTREHASLRLEPPHGRSPSSACWSWAPEARRQPPPLSRPMAHVPCPGPRVPGSMPRPRSSPPPSAVISSVGWLAADVFKTCLCYSRAESYRVTPIKLAHPDEGPPRITMTWCLALSPT